MTHLESSTPPPGLRPAAVALRAAQNSGLAFSSDRRAPDPLRQSADGCALWSRLETRYLRLPSPLRHNIFHQTRAPFGPHSDEDLRWRPGAPQACHFASVIANNLSIGNPQVDSRATGFEEPGNPSWSTAGVAPVMCKNVLGKSQAAVEARCHGLRPGGGSSRRTINPIIAHLIMASLVSGSRS